MLFQVIKFLKSFSQTVWLTNDLSVVVPNDNFHGFLIDSQANIYGNFPSFFATSSLFSVTFTIEL